jgi:hypothetical protein
MPRAFLLRHPTAFRLRRPLPLLLALAGLTLGATAHASPAAAIPLTDSRPTNFWDFAIAATLGAAACVYLLCSKSLSEATQRADVELQREKEANKRAIEEQRVVGEAAKSLAYTLERHGADEQARNATLEALQPLLDRLAGTRKAP